jgi:hypothetical protein
MSCGESGGNRHCNFGLEVGRLLQNCRWLNSPSGTRPVPIWRWGSGPREHAKARPYKEVPKEECLPDVGNALIFRFVKDLMRRRPAVNHLPRRGVW